MAEKSISIVGEIVEVAAKTALSAIPSDGISVSRTNAFHNRDKDY